jgi:hypothetical protein
MLGTPGVHDGAREPDQRDPQRHYRGGGHQDGDPMGTTPSKVLNVQLCYTNFINNAHFGTLDSAL